MQACQVEPGRPACPRRPLRGGEGHSRPERRRSRGSPGPGVLPGGGCWAGRGLPGPGGPGPAGPPAASPPLPRRAAREDGPAPGDVRSARPGPEEEQAGGQAGSGPGAAPLHQRVRHGRGPGPPGGTGRAGRWWREEEEVGVVLSVWGHPAGRWFVSRRTRDGLRRPRTRIGGELRPLRGRAAHGAGGGLIRSRKRLARLCRVPPRAHGATPPATGR